MSDTQDVEALVARLEAIGESLKRPNGDDSRSTAAIREAATALRTVARERDEAKAGYGGLLSTWAESRDRHLAAESERDKALAELDRLRKLCTHDDDDICQTLGKALGYPWYKDDQSNFPGATEENGVCVGEHVAASIAAEAAKRLDALKSERDELLREKERLGEVLRECQRTLAMMVSPEGARQTTVINAFAACVEAEAKARSALENGSGRNLADANSKSPDQSERIAVLEAALREKDEALKPFADQSKRFDEGAVRMGFAPSFDEYRPAVSFTHGELRAARRAYDALPAALTPLGEE